MAGAEPDWRWTDGDGTLAVDGARAFCIFDVVMTGRYWQDPQRSVPMTA